MKLKSEYVLRQVAGTWVVLPLGSTSVDFNGMLKLNDSGAMLWKVLEQGGGKDALVDALTGEYDVSRQQAEADVEEFLNKLAQCGCIQE